MYRIRRSSAADAEAMHALMAEAARGAAAELYVVDPLDYVRDHAGDSPLGFGYVAESGAGALAGILFVRFPGEAADNLARDLGYEEDVALRCAHIESVAVAAEHRGNGLHSRMLAAADAELLRRGAPVSLATVAPDNRWSLDNFLAAGYVEAARLLKYGGLLRAVLCKPLA